ncbi:hypothetical protein D3C85_796180 [compost metagenome]
MGIETRSVVDFRVTPFGAEEAHDLAGRQVEQRTVDAEADDLLFILGDARNRTEDVVDPGLRQLAADDVGAQSRGCDATRVRSQRGALEAALAVADDVQAFAQTIREELLAGVFRTRPRIAGRQVVAPFRDEEVTLDADDVTVEDLLLRRVVVAEADEGADADLLALAQTLVAGEGAPLQVGRDQRAVLGVVERQLAVVGLRRLALVDQEFAVQFGVAQGVQLIAAFTVEGDDLDRRDQRLVQHPIVEGVADVGVQRGQTLVEVVAVDQVAAADSFKAGQTVSCARVRTPAVEVDAVGEDARRHAGGDRQVRTQGGAEFVGDKRIHRQGASADRVDRRAVRARARDRVALRHAGHRVDVVTAEAATVGLAARERTVAQGQFVALIELDRTGGAPAVATGAGHDREAVRTTRAVGFQRLVVLTFDDQAFKVLAGLDVDHAGHGVRAVHRRGAVAQDFDAVDHGGRQDVQVGRTDRAARTGGRDATAVQQHQGAARAHAAQADGVGAGAAVGDVAAVGVVDLRRAAGDGRALQRFRGRGEALQGGFFTRHDLGRRRGVVVVAANARTDDDDFVDGRCGFLGIGCVLSERGSRSEQGQRQCSGASHHGRAQQVVFTSAHMPLCTCEY